MMEESTLRPIASRRNLMDRLQKSFARNADRQAILAGTRELSYRRLEAWTEAVAAALNDVLPGGKGRLAVVSRHPLEYIPAMLAAFRGGALYIPLDAEAPHERLRRITAEVEPDAILCDAPELLPSCLSPFPLIPFPACPGPDARPASRDESRKAEAPGEAPAYLFHTSGSTGRPKGIVGKLASLDHFVEWETGFFGLDATCRISQFTTPTFDAFLRDVLTPLAVGGTVCLPPSRPTLMDSDALWHWIEDSGISLIHCVPSLFAALLEGNWKEKKLPQLKHILLAGEALPLPLASAWLEHWQGRIELVNLYGSTETTMVKLFHRITPKDVERGFIPVGKPMPETEAWILGPDGKTCKPGQAGEIFVATPHRTLGYFQGPGRIDKPFVSIPQSSHPAYPTGDRGMLLPDGSIRLLGRKDRQVKIGGVRVEPEEVEQALRSIAAVKDCAVTLLEARVERENLIAKQAVSGMTPTGSGEHQLTAFLVLEQPLTVADIRPRLEEMLPAAAIPQKFLKIARLPRNSNGKTDYRALPAPPGAMPLPAEEVIPLETTAEQAVAEVWNEVLGLEVLSRESNFFHLGGDSLKAMQVINRMRRGWKTSAQVTDLLRQPVLREFCESLRLEARAEGGDNEPAPQPVSDDPETTYPLTPAQRGLWFLWKMDPDNPYYTCQGIIHLKGGFDFEALRIAWKDVQERHEVLRVRFATVAGNPVQRFVRETRELNPPVDLSRLEEEAALQSIRDEAKAEGERAFDLEKEPLLRCRLYRVGRAYHALRLTMHEITIDLWGMRNLLTDLSRSYEQALRRETPESPPPGPCFRQYLRWQAERPDSSARDEAYWKQELSGELPVLNLPLDRPRKPSPGYRGKSVHRLLSPELSSRLRKLGHERGNTLYVTLLTGFFWMLHRYSGQKDILIGSPLAQRSDGMNHSLLGFFLNMLPLRQTLDPDQRLTELLAATKEKVNGALDASDYPFSRMLEWTGSARDTSTAPVFQVMFNMLSYADPALDSRDFSLSYESLETGYTKYDLSLYAQEYGDRIFLQAAYQTELFGEGTVRRFLKNLETLYESMVNSPESHLKDLDGVHPDERNELLRLARGPEMPLDASGGALIRRFENQVRATPSATALIQNNRSLTYQELNRLANRLAWKLFQAGIDPASPVAICQERTFHMVSSILAAMKMGAPFVFLDPHHPESRNEEILNDCEAKVLVTGKNQRQPASGLKRVLWAEDVDHGNQPHGEIPPVETKDNALFALVYTSATTGKPKGVRIPVKALLNRFEWMWSAYPFTGDEVMLLQKPMSLVAASWECLGGLLAGIPTVIAQPETVRDPAALARLCDRHGVTRIYGSPALLGGILAEKKRTPRAYRDLRLAFTSAEAVSPDQVRAWMDAFPDVPLYNLYGSTECSSNALQYDCRELDSEAIRVPLGKPLPNIRAYILDEHRRLLPKGANGQLCIAGACLADGYWRKETAAPARFARPAAGSAIPEALLFQTGDLARFRMDDQIEFLGRQDFQINLRGFRIEPAEIENALHQLDVVEESAVKLIHPPEGPARLAAYVVARATTTEVKLRRELRGRIPDYMIPEVMVFLESLPRNPGGKVDRAALRLPDPETFRTLAPVAATDASPVALLTRLWQEQLKRADIHPRDNFFDLGGHSLMASQLFARIEDLTGKSLPVSALYRSPTIEALAAELEAASGNKSTLVTMREQGGKVPLVCVSPWNVSTFSFRHLKDHLDSDRPLFGLECVAGPGKENPAESIEALLERYLPDLKKRFPTGPIHLCGYSGGGVLAWELAARLAKEDCRVGFLFLFDTSRPGYKDEPVREMNGGRWMQSKGYGHLRNAWNRPHWKKLSYPLETLWMKVRWHLDQGSPGKRRINRERQREMEERKRNFAGYIPSRYEGRAVLLTARQRRLETILDPSLGWNRYHGTGVEIHEVPGEHNTMLLEPHVRKLCRVMDKILQSSNPG